MVLFYIFVNIIDIGLVKDSWILIPASTFMLLQYIVLVEVCEENQVSRICSWKEEYFFF